MKRDRPFDLLSTWLATAVREAAPPMWKVRMVSCVPGSPIDCAAITPTASPTFTSGRGPDRGRSTWRTSRSAYRR